jgi:hypothetical protein
MHKSKIVCRLLGKARVRLTGCSMFVAILCAWGAAPNAHAQGLAPATPGREYIRMNGQVVALEMQVAGQSGCNGSGSQGDASSLSRVGTVSTSSFIWSLDYNGNWCMDGSGEQIQWGLANDTPVFGDWNGDGKAHAGVWRVTGGNGYFYLNANDNLV